MTRKERNPKDIKIGDYTLEEILKRNKHWLNEDCEKWEYMRANLRNTNSDGVNLYNVDLSFNDKLRKGIKLSEPIIGWKKCQNNVLVKLEIPRGAIVFSINNNECRTDKAKVLEIIGGNRAYSNHKFFSYYVGDIIEVFNFNCEYNVEYAEGIHFFRTRKESEEYSKF